MKLSTCIWFSIRVCIASFTTLVFFASHARCADRPNIVWLLSEDNSVHYFKMYSPTGTETRRIAELAQHGLFFQNAFSNAPVCSVARTTLITSCYGPRIGTQFHRRSVSVPMPDGVQMFPAYLRDAGYYTTNNQKKDYNAVETKGTWNESSAKASWRGRTKDQPFFHMQSFTTTHESSLHFNQETFNNHKTETDPKSVAIAPYHPDTPLFRYTVAKYHDNIRKVDQQIGEVVDQLSHEGVLEDTFVFYFGDHGGVLPRGKGYAYESGLHVPLVVRIPKNFKHLVTHQFGSSLNGFVQFVDFGPTVLNLAGVTPPSGIDGRAFLGPNIKQQDTESRDEAIGYADRFDEKYDLVRTFRKGKYEYVRSYQPFNFDGLHNNYRYLMLAYQEWRELFHQGRLNDKQRQFFLPRPAEMLFDLESDPHEVNNLANREDLRPVLFSMREGLRSKLKQLPDLSFYPESHLAEHAFDNPVKFGQNHKAEIARLIDIADLSLQSFASAQPQLQSALQSTSFSERYWGCIVCSRFGKKASGFVEMAKGLAATDPDLLVRTRAAEFLGLTSEQDPRPTLMDCLKKSKSGIECNLILNTVALLHTGSPGYQFDVSASSLDPTMGKNEEVGRRLTFFQRAR